MNSIGGTHTQLLALAARLSLSGKVIWKPGKKGFKTNCPCHDDNTPSLDIDLRDGQLYWNCRAGCEQETVRLALGLTGRARSDDLLRAAPRSEHSKPRNEIGELLGGPTSLANSEHKGRTKRWAYLNHRGEKAFLCRSPGKKMWTYPEGIQSPFWPLLSHPTIDPDKPIAIVEGEKTLEAVAAIGRQAMTFKSGNIDLLAPTIKRLKLSDFILCPDADNPGKKYMDKVEAALLKLGISEVRRIDTESWRDGDDLADLPVSQRKLELDNAQRFKLEISDSRDTAMPAETRAEPIHKVVHLDDYRKTEFPPAVGGLPWTDRELRRPEPISPDYAYPGTVQMLFGPPGAGKSLFAILLSLEIMTGRRLVTLESLEIDNANVMFWWDDEGDTSLGLRLQAAMEHYRVSEDTIFDRMFRLKGDNDEPWGFEIRGGDDQAKPVVDFIVSEMRRCNCRMLVIDTLSVIAPEAEEKNQTATQLLKHLMRIATACNACILLVHHTRKPESGKRITPELWAMRGATALAGKARMVHYMDAAENDDEYILTCVKSSYHARPVPAHYRIVSELPAYGHSQTEGVLQAIKTPDAFVGMTGDQAKVHFNAIVTLPPEQRRAAVNATGWIGLGLAASMSVEDAHIPKSAGRKQCIDILTAWTRNGLLRVTHEVLESTGDRHPRPVLTKAQDWPEPADG